MYFSVETNLAFHDDRAGQEFRAEGQTICLRLSQPEFRQLTADEQRLLLEGRWCQAYQIQSGETLFAMADKPRWRFLASCPQPVTLEHLRLVCELTSAPTRSIEGKKARRALEFLHELVDMRLHEESNWRAVPEEHFRIFTIHDGRNRLVVSLPQRARRLIEPEPIVAAVRALVEKLAFGYEVHTPRS